MNTRDSLDLGSDLGSLTPPYKPPYQDDCQGRSEGSKGIDSTQTVTSPALVSPDRLERRARDRRPGSEKQKPRRAAVKEGLWELHREERLDTKQMIAARRFTRAAITSPARVSASPSRARGLFRTRTLEPWEVCPMPKPMIDRRRSA